MIEGKKLRVLHIEDDPAWRIGAELTLIGAKVDFLLDTITDNADGAEIIDGIIDGSEQPYDIYIIGDGAESDVSASSLLKSKRAAGLGGYVIAQSARSFGVELRQELVDIDLGKSDQSRLLQVIKDYITVEAK